MTSFILNSWQQLPEKIDPVLFSIGAIEIRYYGLMFVLSILTGYWIYIWRCRNDHLNYPQKKAEDFFLWAVIGVIAGGRLGYVLFYGWDYYLRHPAEIILPFRIQEGFQYTGISGMSYHGGLLGALLAALVFCRIHKFPFWKFVDFLVPAIPAGYTFGRIGNLLNGELFGRITNVPWGMYFPLSPTHQLRHPSQLYEAFFEGVVLFLILWHLRNKRYFGGFIFSLYVIGYGFVRFLIEFTREPDSHLGLVLGPLTMGQILCLSMILAGTILIVILSIMSSPKRAR